MEPTAKAWTCPNCVATVASPFCPDCGERPVAAPDLSARGLAAQLLKAAGGIDGRVVRSLRALLASPGALTLAYVAGRRKPFIGPFQLFLLANVLFFGVQSLTHTKIFSSPLDSHLHFQDWSDVAQRMVDARLAMRRTTLAAYAPLFDQAVVLNAKSLVVLMTVPFAALLPIVFFGSRRPLAQHAVFSLHAWTFLLLLFCTSLAIAGIDRALGGSGLASAAMDNALTTLNLVACGVYLWFAIGAVYGSAGSRRALATVVLTLTVGVVVVAYRFAIFAITLYTT